MTDIPDAFISKAKEIYETNWPDPVLAIAEALMQASNTPPAQKAGERDGSLLENTWGAIEVECFPDGSVMLTQERDDIRIDEESIGSLIAELQKILREKQEVQSW